MHFGETKAGHELSAFLIVITYIVGYEYKTIDRYSRKGHITHELQKKL